jgi:hypothetical protein
VWNKFVEFCLVLEDILVQESKESSGDEIDKIRASEVGWRGKMHGV